MKLLCVDEEQTFLRYLTKRLVKHGFEVSMAFSGEEAIMTAVRENFDLALIDLSMHGMDGISVKKELDAMGNKIPCIFLADPKEEKDLEEICDGNALLRKPLDIDILIKTIHATYEHHLVGKQSCAE